MHFDTKDKIILSLSGILLVAMIITIIFIKYQEDKYLKEIQNINNLMAKLTPTVKLDEGLYQKLTLVQDNLEKYIESVDKNLADKLNKMDMKLLQVTNTAMTIKEQTFKINEENNKRGDGKVIKEMLKGKNEKETATRIRFEQTQGYFKIEGYTIDSPVEAYVKLSQSKPLVITTGLIIDKENKYSTIVEFPPDFPIKDFVVNYSGMDLNGLIEPYIEHWYNRFFVGLNTYVSKQGLAIGPSIGYKLNRFLLAPSLLVGTDANFWYGINAWYNIGGK